MSKLIVNASALRKSSDAYMELFSDEKLKVYALKGGRFEVVSGSTHAIAHNLQEVAEKVDNLDLHDCALAGTDVIASINQKLGSQYRLEIHASKRDGEGTEVVHSVEGSKEFLANQMTGSIPLDITGMMPGQRYQMTPNMFNGDYAVLIPMNSIGLPELSPSLSPNQMWEPQPLTKGDLIQGIDPTMGTVIKTLVSNAYPNGSIQDSNGKIYSADEVELYQFCKVQDSPEPAYSEPDLPLYDSENIPTYNPTGEVESVAPMIGNLANYNTILEASGGILSDFIRKAGKFALADRCSLNKIKVSGIDKKGQATDGELEWNVKIASPHYKRSSLITIPMTMVKGDLSIGKYFIASTGKKFPLTVEALDAHLGRLADDPFSYITKQSGYPSTLKCDADIDAICEAVKTAVHPAGEKEQEAGYSGEDYVVFDNGGNTIDRYTMIGVDSGEMIGSDANPFSPQGFGQHVGDADKMSEEFHTTEEYIQYMREHQDNLEEGIGKEISKDELPKDARKFADENFGAHDEEGNSVNSSKKTAVDASEVAEEVVDKDKPLTKIPGGEAEGKKPSVFDKGQLEKGIAVEMEHTDNPEVSAEIAMDHLAESPESNKEYYTKLDTMEKEIEKDSSKKTAADEKESKVRCNNCMGEYTEDELELLEDKNGNFKGCPKCKTDAYLMDDFIPYTDEEENAEGSKKAEASKKTVAKTTTVVESMPLNWDSGDNMGDWGEEDAGAAWRGMFEEWLTENYPDLALVGDEIYGPATYRFPDANVQHDTPKAEDLKPLPDGGVYREFEDLHQDDWSEAIQDYLDGEEKTGSKKTASVGGDIPVGILNIDEGKYTIMARPVDGGFITVAISPEGKEELIYEGRVQEDLFDVENDLASSYADRNVWDFEFIKERIASKKTAGIIVSDNYFWSVAEDLNGSFDLFDTGNLEEDCNTAFGYVMQNKSIVKECEAKGLSSMDCARQLYEQRGNTVMAKKVVAEEGLDEFADFYEAVLKVVESQGLTGDSALELMDSHTDEILSGMDQKKSPEAVADEIKNKVMASKKVAGTPEDSAREMVGDGKKPNKYWVTTDSGFEISSKEAPNSYEGVTEVEGFEWNPTYKPETFGPFDSYDEAFKKLQELSTGIYDGGEPKEDQANRVSIEDRLVGVCYETLYMGKWTRFGYRFHKLTTDDTEHGSFASKKVVAFDFSKGQDIKVGDTVSYRGDKTGKVLSVSRVQDVYSDQEEFEDFAEGYGSDGLSWDGNEIMTVAVGDDMFSEEFFIYEVNKVNTPVEGAKKTASDIVGEWGTFKDVLKSAETKEQAVAKLTEMGWVNPFHPNQQEEAETIAEAVERLWNQEKTANDPNVPENKASAIIDQAIKDYIESLPNSVKGQPDYYVGEDEDRWMNEEEIPEDKKEEARKAYILDTLSNNQGFEYFKDTLVSAVRDEISEEELSEEDLQELVSNWDSDLGAELPSEMGIEYGEPGDLTVVLYKDLVPTQEEIMKEKEAEGQQVLPGLERGEG